MNFSLHTVGSWISDWSASDLARLLLDPVIKCSAILALGFATISLLRRASAAHRSLAWLAVFTTLLILPLAYAITPLWSVPVMTIQHTVPPVQARPAPAIEISTPAAPALAAPLPSPASAAWSSAEVLTLLYFTGVVCLLAFRLVGAWQLRRIARASLAPDASIVTLVSDIQRRHGIRRAITVLLSHRATVPMTWGTFRPVLMLPASCAEWSRADLRAALEHELAHIAHHDAARRWLGTLVTALWWPQPLVWLASKAWRLEQERACDDAVVCSGADAGRYAEQLIAAARSVRLGGFQSAAALVMAMPSDLETRLRAVVASDVNRSSAGRAAIAITATVVVLIATFCAAFEAKAKAAAASNPRMIYITTKFVELSDTAAPVEHPALKQARDGQPVVVSDAEMQELLRQLAQKKGVDLMSAPSVTTKSGLQATVEVVREFIYPTEFGEKDGDLVPTTFEMLPIGVHVELNPAWQADGAIRLKPVEAQINEFHGFIVGGKANLVAKGNGFTFDDTKEFVGRDHLLPKASRVGDIASKESMSIDHWKNDPVKKGEVSKPVFSTLSWTGDVKLKPGEWQVCFLKLKGAGKPPAGERRVWFFISAGEAKAAPATPETAGAPKEPTVTVMGGVVKQGKYAIKPGMTVIDALKLAGGPLPGGAMLRKVKLTRGNAEKRKTILVERDKFGFIQLKDGDHLQVPE